MRPVQGSTSERRIPLFQLSLLLLVGFTLLSILAASLHEHFQNRRFNQALLLQFRQGDKFLNQLENDLLMGAMHLSACPAGDLLRIDEDGSITVSTLEQNGDAVPLVRELSKGETNRAAVATGSQIFPGAEVAICNRFVLKKVKIMGVENTSFPGINYLVTDRDISEFTGSREPTTLAKIKTVHYAVGIDDVARPALFRNDGGERQVMVRNVESFAVTKGANVGVEDAQLDTLQVNLKIAPGDPALAGLVPSLALERRIPWTLVNETTAMNATRLLQGLETAGAAEAAKK